MKIRIRHGECTSIGNYRDNNEDRKFVDADRQTYVVADGMGGQVAGEQASQIAVELVPNHLRQLAIETQDPEEIRKVLRKAVIAGNDAIIAQGIEDPSLQNMGTTIVVSMIRGDQVYIAHLGDSRAMLFRDHKAEVITTDHNIAEALFRANTITKEEREHHRFKHVLWKYMGSKEAVDGPDINDRSLRPGDRIVLASDGLTGVVNEDAICDEIYKYSDPQRCADALVQFALDKGSKDNVTVVVLFVEAA